MKKTILIFLFLLFISTNVFADVYLTYNSKTNDIIDLSKREDVVLEKDWKRIKLSGNLEDYNGEFQYRPNMYKYKNGNIILNIEKMSEKALAEQERIEKQQELKMIEKQLKLDALKKLKAEGKTFKHIKESDFK